MRRAPPHAQLLPCAGEAEADGEKLREKPRDRHRGLQMMTTVPKQMVGGKGLFSSFAISREHYVDSLGARPHPLRARPRSALMHWRAQANCRRSARRGSW